MISKKISIALLAAVTLLLIIIGLLLQPIPQPQDYHQFADQRSWLGIPNAENVLLNIPLALVGIWGLFLLFSPGKIQFINRLERWPWIGISIGLVLTALGSAYYHLAPDNARLVWDRLPMTMVFMSLVTALINDRFSIRIGLWLWPLLLGIGIYSVLQWYMSELQGAGDMRLYVALQIYALVITFLMLLIPSHYSRSSDLAMVVVFYMLAKIFELFDHQFYRLDNQIISGHTLKHLAATIAAAWLLYMLWKRKIIHKNK